MFSVSANQTFPSTQWTDSFKNPKFSGRREFKAAPPHSPRGFAARIPKLYLARESRQLRRLKRLRLRLRLRQRVRYKTMRFNEQTIDLHMRNNFWYISLPYSAKQQREMTKFKFYGVRGTHDGELLILCLNLIAIHTNNVPR